MEAKGGSTIIVGIDPGTTVGLAVIDFNGEIRILKSKKEWCVEEIVLDIARIGKPHIVATDKASLPEFVRRVASSFGSEIFVPNEDIPISFKKEIARRFGVKDDHQRDALSAAVFAYKKMRPRIIQIKKELRDREDELIGNRLIQGREFNNSQRIRNNEENQDEIRRLKKDIEKTKRLLKELRQKLKTKKQSTSRDKKDQKIKMLKSELAEERQKIKQLEREMGKLAAKQKMIERLINKFVKGEIDIFYGEVPPGYATIMQVGGAYFAKEVHKSRDVDVDRIEEMVNEYRKTKLKRLGLEDVSKDGNDDNE